MAEECFKLRCDAEYLQIPLTQEATTTTVTEGTETLPETKKMNQRCLIIDVMKMILCWVVEVNLENNHTQHLFAKS